MPITKFILPLVLLLFKRSSLKATLSPGQSPGFAYDTKPGEFLDLSHAAAIRLRIFNAGENQLLSVRVDDASSKDFATRFQSDLPIRLVKGDNNVEIDTAQ